MPPSCVDIYRGGVHVCSFNRLPSVNAVYTQWVQDALRLLVWIKSMACDSLHQQLGTAFGIMLGGCSTVRNFLYAERFDGSWIRKQSSLVVFAGNVFLYKDNFMYVDKDCRIPLSDVEPFSFVLRPAEDSIACTALNTDATKGNDEDGSNGKSTNPTGLSCST